jgi:hypothetical protein
MMTAEKEAGVREALLVGVCEKLAGSGGDWDRVSRSR